MLNGFEEVNNTLCNQIFLQTAKISILKDIEHGLLPIFDKFIIEISAVEEQFYLIKY